MDFFGDTELATWDGRDPAANPPTFFKEFVEGYQVAVDQHIKLAKLSKDARMRQLQVLEKAKALKQKENIQSGKKEMIAQMCSVLDKPVGELIVADAGRQWVNELTSDTPMDKDAMTDKLMKEFKPEDNDRTAIKAILDLNPVEVHRETLVKAKQKKVEEQQKQTQPTKKNRKRLQYADVSSVELSTDEQLDL